jgi:DNA polymerase elongation subunit (family B)
MVADWDGFCERHQAEWLAATKERAALDPRTGRVLAIGFQRLGEDAEPRYLVGEKETLLLTAWWQLLAANDGDRYVFHNGYGFDLRFLARRSWVHDITVPDWALTFQGDRVRFNNAIFLDTMGAWCMGRSNEYISLDNLAKIFGLEGKLKGCTGEDFARMYRGTEEERKLAMDYLAQDVRVTLNIAKRMGME